ncbi:MAG: class I SAM-dependent methyltransferase [Flavobacteriaceae bacterium]|nr:class I SAM-dependent methyltransferase [Flavobacteriaceae bacterium]
MLFQIKPYIQFLLKSTNQHGIHSPFVYNLVSKCFYTNTNSSKLKQIIQYRNDLLQNHSKITITDFGKGSKVFKSNEREISKIAKIAGISKKRSKLLIRIVEYFKPNNVLEIGTSLGIGTASLYIGNPTLRITTLEGCSNTAKTAQNQFKKFYLGNINIKIGDFKETLPSILKSNIFDLVYFDGNHQKKPTIDYFEQCLNSINNNSVFIFDDIHWSKEMTEAWEYIKNHEKVTVSIDTYFWGIVFFRKEQKKEHFTVRV